MDHHRVIIFVFHRWLFRSASCRASVAMKTGFQKEIHGEQAASCFQHPSLRKIQSPAGSMTTPGMETPDMLSRLSTKIRFIREVRVFSRLRRPCAPAENRRSGRSGDGLPQAARRAQSPGGDKSTAHYNERKLHFGSMKADCHDRGSAFRPLSTTNQHEFPG